MRILHIIGKLNKELGGTTFAVLNILKTENLLGIKSDVLTVSDNKALHFLEISNLRIFRPFFPKRFTRSKEANEWLNENALNYDLVILHGIWFIINIDASKILINAGIPYVVWPHGSLDPFDLLKKRILKKILGPLFIKKFLENSAGICCTSPKEAELLESYNAKIIKKILPLSIELPEEKGVKGAFRAAYNIPSKSFLLLFLSRIDYKKGLDLIIPAIAKLKYEFPTLVLAIAGSGTTDYIKKVKGWIKEYEIEDRVVFCDFLIGKDKANAFVDSDCYILPSRNENFGISIIESLGHGLPVLISENVYIWNDIVNEEAGWLTEMNEDSLSKKIKEIILNKEDYLIKKSNSTAVARKFSPQSLSMLYKDFYHSICKEKDLHVNC